MNATRPPCLEELESRRLLTVTLDGAGNLTVNGTSGDDVISIHRDLKRQSKYLITINGSGEKVPVSPVATIIVNAGDGDDEVRFDEQPGRISAQKRVFGGNGDDSVSATARANRISTSTSYFDGGDGNDSLSGGGAGAAQETLLGGAGNDQLGGSPRSDSIDGGDGNDTCYANGGGDYIAGGLGDDSLEGFDGPDTLLGQDGNDSLIGYRGDDLLYGGDGQDTLDGRSGDDVLFGGAGDDRLAGGTDDDRLFGDAGDDILAGSDGNDTLAGDDEDSVYAAGAAPLPAYGLDVLDGGLGDDVLIGGPRRISDGAGRDVLVGGAGSDVMNLNGGVDTGEEPVDVVPNIGLHFGSGRDVQFHYLNFNLRIVAGNPSQHLQIPLITGNISRNVAIQTTDTNGNVQFKYTGFSERSDLMLGEFSTVWGVTFDANHLGRFISGVTTTSPLTMTVNGQAVTQRGDYLLKEGDQIVIDVGTPI